MLEAIKNRQSVRSFTETVPQATQIEEILRAGMQAPSAMNQQPWNFLVVDDPALLAQLAKAAPHAKLIEKAPIGIVLLMQTDRLKKENMAVQDMSACMENMLVETVNQGLGACWMGIYPEQDRMDFLRSLLCLPDNLSAFALMACGYPQEQHAPQQRFNELKVHHNHIHPYNIEFIEQTDRFVLQVNAHEVGYLLFEKNNTLTITKSYVYEQYRSQGWGSVLIEYFERYVREHDIYFTSQCDYVTHKLENCPYLMS